MAKQRGRRPVLESASIAVLERALAKRRRDVAQLEGRRIQLACQLADVEAELRALRGEAAPEQPPAEQAAPPARPARRSRRRAGGGLSLSEAVANVLKGATEPLRAAQVLERVEAAGYRSQAKNFKHLVHKALGRHPQAARVGRGLYAFAG